MSDSAAMDRQMARAPSAGPHRALGFLHREQPVPIDEGAVVLGQQRVPILARDAIDALDDGDFDRRRIRARIAGRRVLVIVLVPS